MIVISNSSPIIALAEIRGSYVLSGLFGKVYIPDEVFQEVVISNPHLNQRIYIEEMINRVIEIQKTTIKIQFKRSIDAGEKAVLNLAVQKQADLLIIDEKRAR